MQCAKCSSRHIKLSQSKPLHFPFAYAGIILSSITSDAPGKGLLLLLQ